MGFRIKIAAYISWFDESPSLLATTVAGVARFCDILVAHDGAYALFPAARPRSHPDQSEAILRAAEAADVACMIYRPQDIYHGNEVEKRNEGLRFCRSLLEPDEDWLFVIDADYHVLRCEPERIRAELSETPYDAASYVILDGGDWMADEARSKLATEMPLSTEWTVRTRDAYRWTPSLEIGPTHFHYSRWDNGDRRWMRGPLTAEDGLEDAHDLDSALAVYHRRNDRPLVRQEAAKVYYERRIEYKIEDKTGVPA